LKTPIHNKIVYIARCYDCQKVQTLTRHGVGDAAAGLGLHFLHMSEGPFLHDAGQLIIFRNVKRIPWSLLDQIENMFVSQINVLQGGISELGTRRYLYKLCSATSCS